MIHSYNIKSNSSRCHFSNMKVKELKQYCRDNKIKGFSKYNKKDLINYITNHNIYIEKKVLNEFVDEINLKDIILGYI